MMAVDVSLARSSCLGPLDLFVVHMDVIGVFLLVLAFFLRFSPGPVGLVISGLEVDAVIVAAKRTTGSAERALFTLRLDLFFAADIADEVTTAGPDLTARHAEGAVADATVEASVIAEVEGGQSFLNRHFEAFDQLVSGKKLHNTTVKVDHLPLTKGGGFITLLSAILDALGVELELDAKLGCFVFRDKLDVDGSAWGVRPGVQHGDVRERQVEANRGVAGGFHLLCADICDT